MDRLGRFLRSIDSSKAWYIGQPGQGNPKEFGKLHLDANENFCMGGPGMILSRETLRRVGPHIRDCLQTNIFTSHEDVEVGRCIRKYADIPCTWNYEMAKIFMHNGTYRESFAAPEQIPAQVRRALAFHPVKIPEIQHRLFHFTLGQEAANLRSKVVGKKRVIAEYASLSNAPNILPVKSSVSLCNHRERNSGVSDRKQPVWQYFDRWSKCSAGSENPRLAPGEMLRISVADIIDDFFLYANDKAHLKGQFLEFRQLNFGYWRNAPTVGLEFVMNLTEVHRRNLPRRLTFTNSSIVSVRRPYSDLEFREIDFHPGKINDEETRHLREDSTQHGLFSSFKKIFVNGFETET